MTTKTQHPLNWGTYPQPARRTLLCGTAAMVWSACAALAPAAAQTQPTSERTAKPPPPVGTALSLPDLPMLDGTTLHE